MALMFYSFGVWAELLSRYLKIWHVYAFWMGFIFDISGTLTMHLLAEGSFNLKEPHTLTGQISLWLMFAHALWATHVAFRGTETIRKRFHNFSILVWLIWLVPYFGGMYMSMRT